MSIIFEHYKYQKYLEQIKKKNEDNAKKHEDWQEQQIKNALNIKDYK